MTESFPWDNDVPLKKDKKVIKFNVSEKVEEKTTPQPKSEPIVKKEIPEFDLPETSFPEIKEEPKPKTPVVPKLVTDGIALRKHYIDEGWKIISQSFIKKVLYKGEEMGVCPHKLYYTYIRGTHQEEPSDAMLCGCLGETLILGAGRDGQQLTTLGRKRATKKQIAEAEKEGRIAVGDMYTDEIKIRLQAARAKVIFNNYQMYIDENYNIQPKIFVIVDKANKIMLEINPDIYPTPVFYDGKIYTAIADLKFTGNVTNTHGSYCWGTPQYMDHTQAFVYLHATDNLDYTINPHLEKTFFEKCNSAAEKIFLYLVFDFKVPEDQLAFKAVDVKWTPDRKREIVQTIKQAAGIYDCFEYNGWQPTTDFERAYNECKTCPFNYMKPGGTCKIAKTTESI